MADTRYTFPVICIKHDEDTHGQISGSAEESANRDPCKQQEDEHKPDGCTQLLQGEQQPALFVNYEIPTEQQQLVTSNHGIIEGNLMYAGAGKPNDSCHPSIVKTEPVADGHLDSKDNIVDGSNNCVNRDVQPTQTISWIPRIICRHSTVKYETGVDTDLLTTIWVAQPSTQEQHTSTYTMEHDMKSEEGLTISSYCSLAQNTECKEEGFRMYGNQTDVKVERSEVEEDCIDKTMTTEVMDHENREESEPVCAAGSGIASCNIHDKEMDPVKPEVYIDVDMVKLETDADVDAIQTGRHGNSMTRMRTCYVRCDAAQQLVKVNTSQEHITTNQRISCLKDSKTVRSNMTENMCISKQIQMSERPKKKATHTCRVCDKCFSCKSKFERHTRIHTGSKPYQCSVCDKYFSQKAHLATHRRVHNGEKLYQCSVCDKYFTEKGNLAQHMRTHSGERPYQCPVCDKYFTQKGNLKTHIRVHSGDKPYKCTVCRKSFNQSSALTTHRRIHTADKRY